MNVVPDKNEELKLPEEVIIEKLENEDLTKKERRKLKVELFKLWLKKNFDKSIR
jgi:hypothetical protein